MRKCRCCYHNGVPDPPTSAHPGSLSTVFLDRDGVLNEKPPEGSYVAAWTDFHLLPSVPESIRRLNRAGLRVMVVSNQRGIALGLYTPADVQAIHSALQALLQNHGAHIDAFFICPHDKGECNCRKPLPGLFDQAATEFPSISAATSVIIGDSISDIEFGHRLGMKTIFIDGDPTRQKAGAAEARNLAGNSFPSLPEAVDHILESLGHNREA
jgi:D-glycero-D-manno-heptose 1,7-bisphosphate phosphatase